MTVDDGDRRRQRVAAVVFLVLLVALVGAVGFAAISRGGDDEPTAVPPSASASATPVPVEHVMLMARETPGDEFTVPVGKDVQLTPLAASGSSGIIEVAGGAVGLYGGSLELGSCDRSQLVDYLDAHPNKAQAWADVQGIDPSEIRSFVAGLTPLVLRADTLVTNHGYFEGQATTFASVLQAGTAVLVNDVGLPVVRCFCGNPLTAAPVLAAGAVYDGPAWKGFAPASTVRVLPNVDVVPAFDAVDTESNTLFNRPRGTSGELDSTQGQPAPDGVEGTPTDTGIAVEPEPAAATGPESAATAAAEPAASEPAAPEASAAESGGEEPAEPAVPQGEPVTLFEVNSIAGVSSGPPRPSRFTLDAPAYVTSIMTYHYLNEGTPPGTIGLESADGAVLGPWPAAGSEGQGGVPNAYWTVTPNVVVPAGRYTVVDSDPGTWSWALDTRQRGITIVQGVPMAAGEDSPPAEEPAVEEPSAAATSQGPGAGTADCSAYPEGSAMWTLCNHDPLTE